MDTMLISLPSVPIQRYVTLLGEKAVLRYDGEIHFYMRIEAELYHILVYKEEILLEARAY